MLRWLPCLGPRRPGLWVLLCLMLFAGRIRAVEVTLTADTHVNTALPTVNSGGLSNVNVGGGYTGLFQFDLSLLPAGTTSGQVSRAVLRLYVNQVNTAGLVSLQPIHGAWTEYGVTAQTLPSLGSAVQVFSVSQAATYIAVDVTALVQGWIANPASNQGFALTAGTASVQFDSKENDLTAHAAALDVGIVSQGPAGPAGLTGATGATGAAGPSGPAGAPGAQGVPGTTGAAGATGPAGPAGATGAAGPQGPSGFTYEGTYSSTANYASSQVVLYNGSSYISLLASNHGNTPGLSPAYWGLVASGATGTSTGGTTSTPAAIAYRGAYASSTNYAVNDVVLYLGSSYISLATPNAGNTPNASPADWGELAVGGTGVIGPAGPQGPAGQPGAQGLPGLGFEGAYQSSVNYGLDDVVSFQGSSWISQMASNHGNTPGLVPGTWALLAAAGVGTPGATGATGAVGPQGPAGPQGQQGITGDPGPTGLTGAKGAPGLVYQGAYASTMNYALGDVVLWQGASWASLIESNHGNTPDQSPQQWGVLTLQGPTGATGAAGLQGPTGATGALGPVGPPGEKGDQGAQGIAGTAGAEGLTGATGAQGLSGPAGPQGVPGPVGITFQGLYSSTANYALADGVQYNGAGYVSLMASNHGNTPDQSPAAWALFAAAGAAGAIGPAGETGPAGPTGMQGVAGPIGATGLTGVTGPQGPPVANYLGNYNSTNNYAFSDAVSFGGSTYISLIAGNHGNTPGQVPTAWAVLAAQGPSGAMGAVGMAGPQGPSGSAGAPGATGAQGPPVSFIGGWLTTRTYAAGDAVSYGGSSYIALAGNTGREPDISPLYWGVLAQTGAIGAIGATGPQGLQGPTGYAGPQGPTGATGAAGATGSAGPAGPPGVTGTAGPQGVAGPTGPAGLVYQGAYSSGANYSQGDAVTFAGSSYLSLVGGNTGNTPGASPTFWALLAAQGTAGVTGAAGANGQNGATGATGAQGPAGATGAAGAAGVNGAPGLVYQGTYGSTTNYALNDAVSYNGSSYLSLSAGNHGNTPGTSPAAWAVLASVGASGSAGAAGPAGPQGSSGATGAAGPAGATGSAGAPGINFRGTWNAGLNYSTNDSITYAGSTYLALISNSNVEPDTSAQVWAVLAAAGQAGAAGPSGPSGTAATVQVGTVATGSTANVTNSGTASAAVLNFVFPAGTGNGSSGGPGTASTSGIPYQSMVHSVSYAALYYSINNTNQAAAETTSVLTWVPAGCTATSLTAYSQQNATITITLRAGSTPNSLANTALTCQVASGASCTGTGSVTIPQGSFVDLGITHADSNATPVWTAVACN